MTQVYQSIPDMFQKRVAQTPNRVAYQYPRGGTWKTMTWAEANQQVRAVACGLLAQGLEPEQRCAILSGTRVEWVIADVGILSAALATTTIYPSTTAEECAFILKDSESRLCFAEDEAQVAKLRSKKATLPSLSKVVVFDGKPSEDGWVITLEQLLEQGRAWDAANPGAFEKAMAPVNKDSLATLIYTSGTTGTPKGVELPHDAWLYEAEAIDAIRILTADDQQYLWLPLAHAFGKVLEIAQIRIGFTTAIDGRVDKLVENLAVIKPTFVCAVPRIFEKVHNRVVASAKEGGPLKYRVFQWALEVGRQWTRAKQAGKRPSLLLTAQHALAQKLVYSTLQQRFGGRLRFFVSGASALSSYVAEFFASAGVQILEGYGLTETSAASCINLPSKVRFGTVGMPFPGTEVKIAPEDGEILIRGRGVMRGYHHLPEATAETLKDGWLHTGDIGVIEDGFIRITDRKKDLIKTSGGKYVAPQMLEGRLKAICPYVSQVLVHGNNRNFCSALITLDEEAIRKWARDNGLGEKTYSELAAEERVRALIQPYMTQLNSELPSYETVKKFALLPTDLTLEAGQLTPSLKVKRKVVEQQFKTILDGFYAGATASDAA